MPRQGPGNKKTSELVLSMIDAYSGVRPGSFKPRVLDIGCGPGMQTVLIAEHYPGCAVTALDYYPQYLDELMVSAVSAGVAGRILPIEGSMSAMSFGAESFDIIWSEGAIYIIGFTAGLNEWKPFLKPGGWMGVSEATWLTDTRPAEIEEFWNKAYPEMDTIAGNIQKILAAGYAPIGTFLLPAAAWYEDYYDPLIERIALCRHIAEKDSTYRDELLRILEEEEREIDLFRRFSDYYGYVFYLMRKPDSKEG